MTLRTALVSALMLSASCGASATLIDFEDLTLGDTYSPVSLFSTGGVDASIRNFQWSSGAWTSGGVGQVSNWGWAGGTGNEMILNNTNLGLDFVGSVGSAGYLVFQFGEYGGNMNLDINGHFVNFNNWEDLDGATIGGVTVNVLAGGLGNDKGTVEFNGLIDKFLTGGQEYAVDNFRYQLVPAPGALALLGVAGIAGRRRRRSS